MRHRPDPDAALRRFARIAGDPRAELDALLALLRRDATGVAREIPLVAWPLIEAARRAGVGPPAEALAPLGRALDAWERRFGLAEAAGGRVSVAAQAWLVQDLHCLADLHHLAGATGGEAWSARGHRAEDALHRALWDERRAAYADRAADGALVATDDGDALAPLLLLDTPAARVAALCDRLDVPALVRGSAPMGWIAIVGLRRHGRAGAAAELAAAIDAIADDAHRLVAAAGAAS